MSRGEISPETLSNLDRLVYQAIDLDPNKTTGEKVHGRQDIWPDFPKGTEYYHSEVPNYETPNGILAKIFMACAQGDLWIVEYDKDSWKRVPGDADTKPLSSQVFKRPNIVGEERALRLKGILEEIISIQETRNY